MTSVPKRIALMASAPRAIEGEHVKKTQSSERATPMDQVAFMGALLPPGSLGRSIGANGTNV